VAAIALTNIRGVRESGRIFAVPTYFFIVSFGVLLAGGFYRLVTGTLEPVTEPPPVALEALTWFLVLRAFSSGCTAMTGTEAISNGIPAFRAPESRNAAITLAWMAGILATLFVGLTVLASALHVLPSDTETVVSQIARRVFGSGLLYYLIQAATALILVLAANTSFADFPRLSSLLARDRFVPRQFATLGERLVFSNGILVLAGFAALLLVIFRGETHALIPLYAVGVFISFTLSQSGMVRYWWRRRGPGWRHRLAINGTGALATGIVTLVIAATKFTHGAWIVVVVIPMLVVTFLAMHRHYEEVAEALTLEGLEGPPEFQHTVLVLVGDVRASRRRPRGAVRADAGPERHRAGRLRRDRPGPHGEAGGEVGRLGAWRAARRADLTVSLAAPPLARLHRSHPGAGRRPDGDHCRAGVPPATVVAARPAQSDRVAGQGGVALPQEHRRRRRSVPAQTLIGVHPLLQLAQEVLRAGPPRSPGRLDASRYADV